MWTEETEELNTIFQPLSQSDHATSPEALYGELLQEISSYHPSKDTEMIEKAYGIANKAHGSQLRKSGEPYIIHPLCVSIILSKLKMDKETIEAALLHDVVEDTDMTNQDVSDVFGQEVAHLVEGLTKLSHLPCNFDLEEIQAANFRKMLLAMAKDIRVVIIKLADRLHNLRTLQYQPHDKQLKIARETIEIYAPLATRLGISKIKVELDDLSLLYLRPETYHLLDEEVNKLKRSQGDLVDSIIQNINIYLKENKITAKIYSKTKHLFRIYKKMVNQSLEFNDINNAFAICIIVGSAKDCYDALGVLHEHFSPVFGKFKDYIAVPKSNMYQSLHTTLVHGDGKLFEVQIKTYEMLMVAEYGITVYWKYNQYEDGKIIKKSATEKMNWLQQILDWQRDLVDNKDFIGTIKDDFNLLSEKICCFTPKGDIKILPKNSTPIDFAYSIHTVVGNTMSGAKINQGQVPVTALLQDGDIVEIITDREAQGPQSSWLLHVKTPQAKNKINDWLKNHINQEHIDKGISVLKNYCNKNYLDYQFMLESPIFDPAIHSYGHKNKNTFWVALGTGDIDASEFIKRFFKLYNAHVPMKPNMIKSIMIQDPGLCGCNLPVHYSKCCNPMPGDLIAGVVTKNHGISVHQKECPNVLNIIKNSPGQIIDIAWSGKSLDEYDYTVSLGIDVVNRIGLLEDISKVIADNSIEIKSIHVSNKHKEKVTIAITLYVRNKQILSQLIGQIAAIPNVSSVKRNSFS